MVLYPAVQALKNRLVLLDDEEPRPLFRGDAKVFRNSCIEVTVLGSIRGEVRSDARIGGDLSDTDDLDGILDRCRLVTEKALIQSDLSLRSKIIVKARKNYDNLVASISGLADHSGV